MRIRVAATTLALLCVSCSHQTHPTAPPQVTVYFCRAGTDTLVPMPYSNNRQLQGAQLEEFLVNQLLAGPDASQAGVVLFPAGTEATVDLNGSTLTVDLGGTLAQRFHGGASDEVALFKSLTFTATSVPGVTAVQVLVSGKKVATLPGGEFEIDEPLTRGTFAQ